MLYTYVLLSEKDKKFHIGFTEDLRARLEKHNSGKVKSTASRRPLKLVYYEACLHERDAIKREKYFKTGFTRDLKSRFEQHKKGEVDSTRNRRPLELVYYEACLSQHDATKREKYLKTYLGKLFLNNRLKSYLIG